MRNKYLEQRNTHPQHLHSELLQVVHYSTHGLTLFTSEDIFHQYNVKRLGKVYPRPGGMSWSTTLNVRSKKKMSMDLEIFFWNPRH